MAKLPIVAVTQRIDYLPERREQRDGIDQRLMTWIQEAGFLPVCVPNTLGASGHETLLDAWLESFSPRAILLSGGNDIGQFKMRDSTERYLLDWARDRCLPLLGICRGMQMMAVWAGLELEKIDGHVGNRHSLQILESERSADWPQSVNSYHNWGLPKSPDGFVEVALAEDGSIEAIRHRQLPWEGWMWHPERESDFAPQDINRLRGLFGA